MKFAHKRQKTGRARTLTGSARASRQPAATRLAWRRQSRVTVQCTRARPACQDLSKSSHTPVPARRQLSRVGMSFYSESALFTSDAALGVLPYGAWWLASHVGFPRRFAASLCEHWSGMHGRSCRPRTRRAFSCSPGPDNLNRCHC